MPRLDECHPQVVRALEKAGWKVNNRPYAIPVQGRSKPLLVDMTARQGDNAIAVIEVKCFEAGTTDEIYQAVGQYLIYRSLMDDAGLNYPLYLSVPEPVFNGRFRQIALSAANRAKIKLMVVDLANEEIVQWLN